MAGSRNYGGQDYYEAYTESQVESVLTALEVEVINETDTHFMCLCPFHGNTDTPAFAVAKTTGLWICFNPACEKKGNFSNLVRELKGLNPMRAELFIAKHKKGEITPFYKLDKAPDKFPEFPQSKIDEMHVNFWKNEKALAYMRGRGFDDDTLSYFEVGYSPDRILRSGRYRPESIAVPMHDYRGNPVGVIGRSLKGKEFNNSKGLPKRFTMYNMHRARKAGGSIIVVEASFGAMRVHQAGYPNVAATLGNVTKHQLEQLDRYFNKIIIMTDCEPEPLVYDNCVKCGGDCRGHRPGREAGNKIATYLPHKKILWAAYDEGVIFPRGKDPVDIHDDEIRQMLKNVVRTNEYRSWGLDH